jgi:hypothetical protein
MYVCTYVRMCVCMYCMTVTRKNAYFPILHLPTALSKGSTSCCLFHTVRITVLDIRQIKFYLWRTSRGSDGLSSASHCGDPGSIPGIYVWDLKMKKWKWKRFFSPCFFFSTFSTIPLIFATHLHFKGTIIRRLSGTIFKKTILFGVSWNFGQRSTFTLG